MCLSSKVVNLLEWFLRGNTVILLLSTIASPLYGMIHSQKFTNLADDNHMLVSILNILFVPW